MEASALRKLVSLPKEDPQFEQELIYGIRMTIVEDSIEYVVNVTRHPDQDRFLMVISLLNRRYWIIDLKSLIIQQENHENEGLYELERNKYFIFIQSGRWIFTFRTERQRDQRLARFINLQKIVRQKKGPDDQYDPRFLKLFMRYNANEDQFIDDNQLAEVLVNFDVQFDETVRNCIREIAPKYKQGLLKGQFHILMKVLLCKRQLALLFRQYCPAFSDRHLLESTVHFCLTPLMEKNQLVSFLTQEQGMTKQEIDKLLPHFELVQDKLSFHSFCKYVFSDANSIINSNMTMVYQDMNQPLTEYYVHSSHNTYLVGNQLTSDSRAFRYIEDFYDGVRCVELDIHDGKSGPIIKHGFTFTAPVSFRAVIEAIVEYSRQNQEHLPLILSFENHCSIQNQIEMAKILKECLGDKIYVVPENCSNKHRFPSPNALRNKIVVQGTGLLDNIRPNILRAKMEITASKYQRAETIKAFEQLSINYPQEFLNSKKKFAQWCKNAAIERDTKTAKFQEEIHNQRRSLEVQSHVQLMQYYSIFVSKINVDQACWEMGNISEANALNHISDESRMKSLVQFSKKCHVRVYPQGTRFGSSNFNPIPMYEAGAQLVSLNTQSEDIFNMVMVGNFMQNGGKKGGYLLKPTHLRTQDLYATKPYHLNIRIISVHNVSNSYEEFCKIQVKMCLVCSRGDEVLNNSSCQLVEVTPKKEKVYYQALFSTVREFTYIIKELDFAHVYFQIPTCGHISIPVRMMRTGYRVIPLLDRNKQFKPNSYIFAHITLKKGEA